MFSDKSGFGFLGELENAQKLLLLHRFKKQSFKSNLVKSEIAYCEAKILQAQGKAERGSFAFSRND